MVISLKINIFYFNFTLREKSSSIILLSVTGGYSVPGSPVICTVDAAGQARAKGEGLLNGHVGKPAHFIVTGTRSPPAVQVFSPHCNMNSFRLMCKNDFVTQPYV